MLGRIKIVNWEMWLSDALSVNVTPDFLSPRAQT